LALRAQTPSVFPSDWCSRSRSFEGTLVIDLPLGSSKPLPRPEIGPRGTCFFPLGSSFIVKARFVPQDTSREVHRPVFFFMLPKSAGSTDDFLLWESRFPLNFRAKTFFPRFPRNVRVPLHCHFLAAFFDHQPDLFSFYGSDGPSTEGSLPLVPDFHPHVSNVSPLTSVLLSPTFAISLSAAEDFLRRNLTHFLEVHSLS